MFEMDDKKVSEALAVYEEQFRSFEQRHAVGQGIMNSLNRVLNTCGKAFMPSSMDEGESST